MSHSLNPDLEVFRPFGALFDASDDTVFFIKDRAGRYVFFNAALLPRSHHRHPRDITGKTSAEILGDALGAGYERQDQMVICEGRAIRDLLELHVYPDLSVNWCITNKHPLRNTAGKIVGLVGTSRDLKPADMDQAEFDRLSPVLEYVTANIQNAPAVTELAERVALSPYQLDRLIQKVFGMTAGQWVLKQRLDHARNLLRNSNASIAEIALATGYCDQSAFTRQFRKTTGLTPLQFRALSPR